MTGATATRSKTVYEAVIGLEVHAQVLTRSKMFCSCAAGYQGTEPNTHVCPVCMGMPGVLPVINGAAIEATVLTGLALNCRINEKSKFDRKNYPYPDLVKGYQISQWDVPLCVKGWLEVEVEGKRTRLGVTRVHLEEDTAKLIHKTDPSGESYSLVDLNRSGTPLMEIVGEPDMRSPEEAREYLMKLQTILQYLGVSTGNLEVGSMRCDANVSIRPLGQTELPKSKVEVKNMNSFRAVYRALQFEIQRQAEVLEAGGRVVQETRGWNDARGVTVSQRSKEHAHDYRYFPEPDLPSVTVTRDWIEDLRRRLPELPDAKRARFQDQYGLSAHDAEQLSQTKYMADYYEEAVRLAGNLPNGAKAVSNWMLGELSRLLNVEARALDDERVKIRPQHIAELAALVEKKTINQTTAKQVLEQSFKSGKGPAQLVQEQGQTQISSAAEIIPLVDQVIAANPQAVKDFHSGKEPAIKFLVGQVMKVTKGRADPTLARELLQKQLAGAPQS